MSSAPLQYDFPHQLVEMANIPNIDANTGLTQQQAVGAGLTNQKTKLQLGLLQQLIDQQNGAPAPSGGSGMPVASADALADPMSPGGAPIGAGATTPAAPSTDPTHPSNIANTRARLAAKYAPVPNDPQAFAQLQQGRQRSNIMALAGMPEAGIVAQNAQAQYEARMAQINGTRKAAANQDYQYAASVADPAAAGHRHELAYQLHPELKGQLDKLTDDQLGNVSAIRAAMIHETSGMPMEYKDVGGEMTPIDKDTGKPIVGYHDLHKTVTPKDIADMAKEADAIVDGKDVNGVDGKYPQWKVDGFPNRDAYVASHLGLATYHGADVSPKNRAAARAAASAPPATTPQQQPSSPTSVPVAGTAASAAGSGPNASPGPTIPAASPKQFDFSEIPARPTTKASSPGAGINPADLENVKDYNKELGSKIMPERVQQVTQANQDLNKARQAFNIMGQAATGPYAEKITKLQATLQEFGLENIARVKGGDPAALAQLQKLLSQGGLSEFEAAMKAGGGMTRMGSNMADLAINKLNPSVAMPKKAVMGMLQAEMADQQRNVRKWGPAFDAALAQNRDMRSFSAAYDDKFPQADEVEHGTRALARAGVGPKEGKPGSLYPAKETSGVKAVTTQAEYEALSSGDKYTWKGQPRTKK